MKKKNNNSYHLNLPAKELPSVEYRPGDWRNSFHWRVFRIMAELVDGFQFLADFKKTVTFFGSARSEAGSRWYEESRRLGRLLARSGYTIVTGGGPGIMEAGNRGAVEGGGKSVGLNIQLPHEQRINPYVKKGIGFHYFFTRKVMLSYSAQAYIFFPGGLGTLDEVLELLTLVQTHKVHPVPIIMVGRDFWGQLDKWFRQELLKKYRTIDADDLELYSIVDTAAEAMRIIKKSKPRRDF